MSLHVQWIQSVHKVSRCVLSPTACHSELSECETSRFLCLCFIHALDLQSLIAGLDCCCFYSFFQSVCCFSLREEKKPYNVFHWACAVALTVLLVRKGQRGTVTAYCVGLIPVPLCVLFSRCGNQLDFPFTCGRHCRRSKRSAAVKLSAGLVSCCNLIIEIWWRWFLSSVPSLLFVCLPTRHLWWLTPSSTLLCFTPTVLPSSSFSFDWPNKHIQCRLQEFGQFNTVRWCPGYQTRDKAVEDFMEY